MNWWSESFQAFSSFGTQRAIGFSSVTISRQTSDNNRWLSLETTDCTLMISEVKMFLETDWNRILGYWFQLCKRVRFRIFVRFRYFRSVVVTSFTVIDYYNRSFSKASVVIYVLINIDKSMSIFLSFGSFNQDHPMKIWLCPYERFSPILFLEHWTVFSSYK